MGLYTSIILFVIRKKHYIKLLIEKGEGQQLDFKFEVSDAAKIARSLVAFANTDGGKLLIGVKDNGNISGIRSEEEYYMLENAATRFCKPEVSFTSKEWNIDAKKVLEVNIPKSTTIPHRAPDHNNKFKAYIRVADQNILANGIQMKVWQKTFNAKSVEFIYTDDAKQLLSLFSTNKPILFNELIEKTKFTRYNIENMLADLIVMKVLLMFTDETSASFLLNEEVEMDY